LSVKEEPVGIKYSMSYLICDVINYCASSFAMGIIKRIMIKS